MGAIFPDLYFANQNPPRSADKLQRSQQIKLQVKIEGREYLDIFTCQELRVVRVCEVEALQGAGDPRDVLPTPLVRCLQHPLGAGDLRDQHAPVPGHGHDEHCIKYRSEKHLLAVEVGAATFV